MNRIEEFLARRGCSEAALARLMGITPQNINNWNKRNRYPRLMSRAIDGIEAELVVSACIEAEAAIARIRQIAERGITGEVIVLPQFESAEDFRAVYGRGDWLERRLIDTIVAYRLAGEIVIRFKTVEPEKFKAWLAGRKNPPVHVQEQVAEFIAD